MLKKRIHTLLSVGPETLTTEERGKCNVFEVLSYKVGVCTRNIGHWRTGKTIATHGTQLNGLFRQSFMFHKYSTLEALQRSNSRGWEHGSIVKVLEHE